MILTQIGRYDASLLPFFIYFPHYINMHISEFFFPLSLFLIHIFLNSRHNFFALRINQLVDEVKSEVNSYPCMIIQ